MDEDKSSFRSSNGLDMELYVRDDNDDDDVAAAALLNAWRANRCIVPPAIHTKRMDATAMTSGDESVLGLDWCLPLPLLLGRIWDFPLPSFLLFEVEEAAATAEARASLVHCIATAVAADMAHCGRLREVPMRHVKSANAASSVLTTILSVFGMYSLLTVNGVMDATNDAVDDVEDVLGKPYVGVTLTGACASNSILNIPAVDEDDDNAAIGIVVAEGKTISGNTILNSCMAREQFLGRTNGSVASPT
mmetsp:Transcript_29913/g.63440  ORF Transcript_29913/g.63440 Transcript_29913/m.63440 type:complete len:248 (-) Transcript_29913:1486-2229(-)